MRLLQPDDFFFSMAGADGYVGEHRLVMAQSLGRCLHSWELVHHKGIRVKGIANRSDNLIDNLQLVSDDKHKQISILEAKVARLQKKLHTTNVYYLREIQRQDKNFLEWLEYNAPEYVWQNFKDNKDVRSEVDNGSKITR